MSRPQEQNLSAQEKTTEITSHLAWHADLSGAEAEGLLRSKSSFTYLLRQGEKKDHFYLSYVMDEIEFRHLPFIWDHTVEKWFYRNGVHHYGSDLQLFISEIMHRKGMECHPLVPFSKRAS